MVIASGEGCWLTTTDGRKLLDMASGESPRLWTVVGPKRASRSGNPNPMCATAGIGAVSTGHCHPAVVAAVQAQAARVVHAQQNVVGAHTAMVSPDSSALSLVGRRAA